MTTLTSLTIAASVVGFVGGAGLVGGASIARAESGRQVSELVQSVPEDVTRDTDDDAPVIDGSTLKLGIALVAGVATLVSARRRFSHL